MKILFTFLILLSVLSSCIVITTEDKVVELAEKAYFEGQKDALQGDIKIRMKSDSIYMWIASPWDDTKRKPIFNPTYLDSK